MRDEKKESYKEFYKSLWIDRLTGPSNSRESTSEALKRFEQFRSMYVGYSARIADEIFLITEEVLDG